MSKKNFSKNNEERHESLTELNVSFEMAKETRDVIKNVNEEPNIKNIEIAKEVILEDNIISAENKNELLLKLADIIFENISIYNIPDSYEQLKYESKYLSGLSQYSLFAMAPRLKKIKNGYKYLEEKDDKGNSIYTDFKDFVENELNMSRQTAYKLIDIYDYYGSRVAPGRHANILIQYTKLYPTLPLLKAENNIVNKKEKDEIKEYFWTSMLNNISRSELEKEANELKLKYGIIEKKEIQNPVDVNYNYKLKGNQIKIGNDTIELSPNFDSEKARYFKNIIKIVSNNKENGKETYLATIKKGDEKAFKLLENKIKEAREKGLKLNIVLK